jgi:hypothetical protein
VLWALPFWLAARKGWFRTRWSLHPGTQRRVAEWTRLPTERRHALEMWKWQTKECTHCGGIMVSKMRVCQLCRSLNTSTWQFRGVKGKKRQNDDMVWQAFLWHDRKNEYIGTFLFAEEAAQAYDKRARVRCCPRCFPRRTAMTTLRIVHRVLARGGFGEGLARGDRSWPLNDGQIPNSRGVRVHVSTGYNRVEGNRRAPRNGRVSCSPTRNPLRFATLFIAVTLPHPSGHTTRTRAVAAVAGRFS